MCAKIMVIKNNRKGKEVKGKQTLDKFDGIEINLTEREQISEGNENLLVIFTVETTNVDRDSAGKDLSLNELANNRGLHSNSNEGTIEIPPLQLRDDHLTS